MIKILSETKHRKQHTCRTVPPCPRCRHTGTVWGRSSLGVPGRLFHFELPPDPAVGSLSETVSKTVTELECTPGGQNSTRTPSWILWSHITRQNYFGSQMSVVDPCMGRATCVFPLHRFPFCRFPFCRFPFCHFPFCCFPFCRFLFLRFSLPRVRVRIRVCRAVNFRPTQAFYRQCQKCQELTVHLFVHSNALPLLQTQMIIDPYQLLQSCPEFCNV